MQKIEILKFPTNDKQYFIISKPAGMPSAPIKKEDDNNALNILAAQYPEILNVKGKKEIEHGLLHRLDTITSGLIIVAATQLEYDSLLKLQEENKIIKYYEAICRKNYENSQLLQGFPDFSEIKNGSEIKSYFRPYGEGRKEVRPVTSKSGMAALKKIGKPVEYRTKIISITENNSDYKIICSITNGFRHQIRSHLAWSGYPIKYDDLYDFNFKNEKTENIKFSAFKIDINGDVYTQKET